MLVMRATIGRSLSVTSRDETITTGLRPTSGMSAVQTAPRRYTSLFVGDALREQLERAAPPGVALDVLALESREGIHVLLLATDALDRAHERFCDCAREDAICDRVVQTTQSPKQRELELIAEVRGELRVAGDRAEVSLCTKEALAQLTGSAEAVGLRCGSHVDSVGERLRLVYNM